ncbi:MAG TPA: YdcF family protein [Stellaceae bacterium]
MARSRPIADSIGLTWLSRAGHEDEQPRRPAEPADAIVVLGCALDEAGRPSPALVRRTRCGAAAFLAGTAPLLVLSGGGGDGRRRSEAEAMLAVALAAGVPRPAILLERDSANTFENAVRTAALLTPDGRRSVILVTDRYHLPRARLMFRMAGLRVVGTAAPAPQPLRRELPLILREMAATARSVLLLLIGRHRRWR